MKLCVLVMFALCSLHYCIGSNDFDDFHVAPKEIGFKKEYYGDNRYCKNSNQDCSGFVDPNDMRNYVHSSKMMMPSNSKYCRKTPDAGCENCAVYLQRFVGLLLEATGLKNYALTRRNSKIVNLNLIIKQNELEVLQKFVETGKIELSIVNKALTDIFTVQDSVFDDATRWCNTFENFSGYFMDSVKQFFHNLGTHFKEYPLHFIIICVSSICGITLWQIVRTRSYFLLLFSLAFIVFSAGYGWTWYKMYKIADIKRFTSRVLHDEIPIYCRPDQMSWYQYIYYSSYEKDCEEYFRKQMIEPIVEISPLIVLAETLSSFMFYPAEKIGTAIGGFIRGLSGSLSWYTIWFVLPLTMILITVFIIIMVTILCGGRLKFNFFPFSYFEIGIPNDSNRPSIYYKKPRENDDLIEDVPRLELKDTSADISSLQSDATDENEQSSPQVSNKGRNEVRALLKRLKEENMIEYSNSSENESPNKTVTLKHSNETGNSPIHVNINFSPCCKSSDTKEDSDKKGEFNSKVIELKTPQSQEDRS